jgi:hypothetical protein
MSLKTLAEAIILQAAEDFLDEYRQEEDVIFFSGEGFRICSEMARLGHAEKRDLLQLVRKSARTRHPRVMKVMAASTERV